MNFIAQDIAIVMVLVITGWMLKTWLSHREKDERPVDGESGTDVVG